MCSKKTIILISIVITLIIVTLISTGVYFGVKNSDDTNSTNTTSNNTNSNNTNSGIVNNTLVIVDRNEWKSLNVRGTGILELPCKNVVIAHTVTRECYNRVNKNLNCILKNINKLKIFYRSHVLNKFE